jgi:uncharacterized protein (AIM24 family)
MAMFEIEEDQGMRWVKVTLDNETVRAEKRALNHMIGDITMDVPIPGPRDFLVSLVSDESPLRPRYRGTGQLFLESTLGGFHIMEIHEGETWIYSPGAYWASEADITLSIFRERFLTSFWAGEGFFWYQTAAQGKGKVVLSATGPVEALTMTNGRIVVDGNYVIGRTSGIKFSIARAAKSRFSHWLSGEDYARVFEGTGKLLLCTTQYWRIRDKLPTASKDPVLAPLYSSDRR